MFDHVHGASGKRSGSKGGWILCNAFDPAELVTRLEWDRSENVRRFADTDETGEAMQRAGVTDEPDIFNTLAGFTHQAE